MKAEKTERELTLRSSVHYSHLKLKSHTSYDSRDKNKASNFYAPQEMLCILMVSTLGNFDVTLGNNSRFPPRSRMALPTAEFG